MHIPFVDLKRHCQSLKDEIDESIRVVLESGYFILGEKVERFEKAFAAYCGVPYAVAVASGTDALHLALRACDVGVGDEVITVANTCVPTITGITMAGAVPVFVDVDPDTFAMDVDRIEDAITSRTKAILPVHLYGRCTDMEPLCGVARRYGLRVVEDCAQAHGATYRGTKAGTFGDAGCFSFYPTKNLGALGDAGMVVTSDDQIDTRLRLLRSYGETQRYSHQLKGFNSRLDEIQAAVLLAKLPYLEGWNERRREIAKAYQSGLDNTRIVCPRNHPDYGHVYHLFVIRVRDRDTFRARLRDRGVATLIHYPTPIPRQIAYSEFATTMLSLPETDHACREILSLPMFPELTELEVKSVIEACNDALVASS